MVCPEHTALPGHTLQRWLCREHEIATVPPGWAVPRTDCGTAVGPFARCHDLAGEHQAGFSRHLGAYAESLLCLGLRITWVHERSGDGVSASWRQRVLGTGVLLLILCAARVFWSLPACSCIPDTVPAGQPIEPSLSWLLQLPLHLPG